jgi:hypothetical protein
VIIHGQLVPFEVRRLDVIPRITRFAPMKSETQREIETLIEALEPECRERIRAMSDGELIKLHLGYGMWLRNQFREGKLPHLFRSCSAKVTPESRSFDAISAAAIREIWLHIRLSSKGVGPDS